MHRLRSLPLTLALLCAAAPAVAGTAGPGDPDPGDVASPHNWGTVIATPEPVQATTWAVRILGHRGDADARIGETHHPAFPGVPDAYQGALNGPVRPSEDAEWFDHVEGVRAASGHDGSAVAAASSLDELEFGLPYRKGPAGGVQRSPFGAFLKGVTTVATARPGKPIALSATVRSGYLSVAGKKVYSFDGGRIPVNTGVRVPKEPKLPPRLLITVNEQIGTDAQGHPNVTAKGADVPDRNAPGGYANALHITLLGPEPADLTVSHAAVLRSGG